MLISLFNSFVNMSISAALVAAAILLIRRLFSKRLPAFFAYLLWGMVLFRFVVPISIPALFSALGVAGRRSQPAGPGGMAATVQYLDPGQTSLPSSESMGAVLWQLLPWVWLMGAIALLIYGAVGYFTICRKAEMAFIVRDCDILEQCVKHVGLRYIPQLYRSGEFSSPVIVGIFRPIIVLPDSLDIEDTARLRHILTHECVHLRRFDHITKVLFSLALCLHWFNPLAWVSCKLFDRDVEASCDERSLALLGERDKAGYARSLIDLSTVQQSFLRRRIAFAESSLHQRVMNIIRYRPLTGLRRTLVICLVLAIGLVTVTNPLHAPGIFTPRQRHVSVQARQDFDTLSGSLKQALSVGDAFGVLSLSRRQDDYYLPLYRWLAESPLSIRDYKLYPQSEALAYCYLTTEAGVQYVAVLKDGFVDSLQFKEEFESYQLVDREDEAVRLIENLHRFGILDGIENPENLPRSAIAMLCIDEVYHDKRKAGDFPADSIYLDPEEIAQAAREYFGLQNFSYTFDPDLYDEERQAYIYAPGRGGQYDAQVMSLEHEESHTTVTAIVYSDPLHMMPESLITYTLQRRDHVEL